MSGMTTDGTTNGMMREGESITYSSGNVAGGPPDLRFIHYNDVYHVEAGSREPVGGIARFKTVCQYYQHDVSFKGQPEALTFFSGDAFNPSLESSVTKGKHMLGALNAVETAVACLGNHDLDFGVKQFEYLAGQCNFPWLCANVLDPALGEDVPLGHCKRTMMLTSSNGIKIGVIGVVEREWLDTINTLPPNLKYLSASATVSDLAPKLRAEGAEMIVVVAHQRETNDVKLANKVTPGTVDIILGGHDHYYAHDVVNGTHILRSGSDFKQLSYLECRRKTDGSSGWDFHIIRRDIVGSIPQDQAAVEIVEKITAALRPKLEKPMGYTLAPLDARFTTVRLKESNLGNFVCDLMRFHYDGDCCIMAAGTIRGDQIYPPGVLKVKDMMNCFPFEDPCVVIGVRGGNIVKALENSVSKYPALEGRFPQVSNITFAFDPSRAPGARCYDICIGGKPVELEREYKLVTRDYMARGKDGFESLLLAGKGGTARSIVSDENGMLISMILRQYFMSLKVLGKWKNWGAHMGHHWGKIHDGLHGVHPVQEPPEHSGVEISQLAADSKVHDEKLQSDGETRTSLVGTAQHSHHDLAQRPSKARKVERQESEGLYSDSEDDSNDVTLNVSNGSSVSEAELNIMRKVMKKWWRLAGLKGHPNMCATKGEEFGASWTKGICPRTEGRIKIVGVPT
ncbi:Mannosylglucosyl-3-phosphoglycerate phosphatase [Lecanosticta acicola]|uniref:Mannosylglucosyl-3-phosphoglycerate phosphatase n=1 Tax=Lecanosticta acicola TaxID=111012 RepID=A0AAI8YRA9_9PEZI|nr:Mannosylglucosyl-3-phosphoglycerate phosphatase [Lecanosticta acicola]